LEAKRYASNFNLALSQRIPILGKIRVTEP